jgi:hypothetical protein
MLGSAIVEVAIGLVFIYFLLSVIVAHFRIRPRVRPQAVRHSQPGPRPRQGSPRRSAPTGGFLTLLTSLIP